MSELLDELPTAHLEYLLRDGSVGDWLVLGPLTAPLSDGAHMRSSVGRQLALNALFVDSEEITQLPAERSTSEVTVAEGVTLQGMWRVVNTLEDALVDLAHTVGTPHMLCAWAYAQVVLEQAATTSLHLTVANPTQVWINGEAIFSYNELPEEPTQITFSTPLDAGTNEILIRTANVGVGHLPMTIGLRLAHARGSVKLPTLLEPVARRQKLASVMGLAYLVQDVYRREQRIVVRWPNDVPVVDALTLRLQTPSGRIYGEANVMVQKGARVDFGEALQFPEGALEVLIQPQFEEYYVQNMRVQRRIPLHVSNGKWSTLYYGSDAERRQEALEDAAKRTGNLYAEIAKSALGRWSALRHDLVEERLSQLSQRGDGYERSLLGLLGWVARMGDLPDFPQEITWALEERATLLLDYSDEPDHAMLVACDLLAGQLYAQRTFADLNTGEWHRQRAEVWLLAWLSSVAQTGFSQGENEAQLADALLVVSHLADLASSDEVAEMAAAVLDKVAYQVALQSYVGAWGGSQDGGNAAWLHSALLGPLAGVARLWWGQGLFNAECEAVVALACAESYTLPDIVAAVALDRQQESWVQRRDLLFYAGQRDEVNRAAYRTGDYLLASAQGDRRGGSGVNWRVTLGPDATLFGNCPAQCSEHPAWAQNFWQGNAARSRVAQWQDVALIAYLPVAHRLVDFSHAYFPRAMFDEVLIGEGWAMAAKGNGYVALTATGGVELVTRGKTAQRELRANRESVWLVQMGRAQEHGTFAQFVERIFALPLSLETNAARYTTLRGQRIEFSAVAPLNEAFVVDEVAQSLEKFPHIASIYGGAPTLPASSVEIRYQEHKMRVDFGTREAMNGHEAETFEE
jgi:hypothetical protein